MSGCRLKDVLWFFDERGRSPVKEFIDGLNLTERTKVYSLIDQLKDSGHMLHRPAAAYIGHGIYELRPSA